ncbi:MULTISPECIES: hypothetical protein [Shewanella]|jgi:hypothetical protein|uniref:Uncharacterized protein n=1 Tax=Shewanella fodinae TaxID=552357 RepID=A0A4R2F840_9GAMM|nr:MULTISPECIES: hypothetical protein [Shewanella]MDN5370493.1 hypothetical protein [Shewanella sp.]MBO1270272.1 hypothetical protein [Shewanella sp. 4t3-1-2LB]MCL2905588.1 hypothetical protein [Shewanella fodinae]TCN83361.1 hypothetical protein EDC91_11567 [Shewanella fodinae]GGY92210.1 hypothetical protein GCM10007169_06790 [Shewanella fodinae]
MSISDLSQEHPALIHTEHCTVLSHTQRDQGEWVQHTLMLKNYETPFRFRRPKKYRSLKGAQVTLDYYPQTTLVAGFEVETMRVVRIRRS